MSASFRRYGYAILVFLSVLLFAPQYIATAANPLSSHELNSLRAVFTGYVSSGIHAGAGFIGPDGTQQILTPYGSGISYLDGTDRVRIGSQSKTLTGTVIMQMIDKGWFGFDTTIGELASQYNVDLGYAGLPGDSGSLTVAALLNMSSSIPNYMAGTLPGHSQTLWDEWMAANYGTVPDISHATLAALGLADYPEAFAPGMTGSYSNTNSIILSLLAEAVYANKTGTAKSFDLILDEYILSPLGLSNTSLAMGLNTGGVVTGTESGMPITAMDTTIPWTSGAVISTISEQLAWLRELTQNSSGLLSQETFNARMASMQLGNASLLPMGGMVLYYGYNLFVLDLTAMGIDMTITGHGGSIAGYSNFFGWYDQLNLGIVSDAASLTTIDSFGNYTNTPSEALYLELARHTSMLKRSSEITAEALLATPELSATATGANILNTPTVLTGSLTVNASGRNYLYLDLNNPQMLLAAADPTLIFYNTTDGAATGVSSGQNVTFAPGARMEAYGANSTAIEMTGATLTLDGSVAAYGPGARAILLGNGAALNAGSGSRVFVQGGNATGLTITGNTGAAGFAGTAELYGTGAAIEISGRTVNFTGTALATSSALSMDSSFNTVSPDTHTAYGVKLNPGSTLNSSGLIVGQSLYPWNGASYATGQYVLSLEDMPGSISGGVWMDNATLAQTGNRIVGSYAGIVLAGNSNDTVDLNNTAVSGGLYSIASEPGAGGATVTVRNGSVLNGAVSMGSGGNNALTITDSSVNGGLNLGSSTGSSLTVAGSSLLFGLGSRDNPLTGAENVGTLDIQSGTTVNVFLDTASVGNGASFILIDGITGDNSSALPDIALATSLSRALTMTLSAEPSQYVLNFARDLTYYRKNSPNGSLGAMLDAMPEAYASGSLSALSWGMVSPLETMDDPYAAIGLLQPFSLADITRSELMRAQAANRAYRSKLPLAGNQSGRFFAFGDLYGQEFDIDATGQELSNSTLRKDGMSVGLGYRFSETWSGGLFVDYGKIEQRYSRGRGTIEDQVTRMGLFAEAALSPVTILWSGSVGLHDITYARRVRYLNEKFNTDADAVDFLTSLAFTRDFSLTDKLVFTPRAEVAYILNHADAYTEHGGGAALKVRGEEYSYLSSSLGGDLRYDIPVGTGTVFLTAGADWWHQYLDRPELSASMAADPQFGFTTTGRTADNDIGRVRAALGTAWGDFSAQLGYERLQGRHISANELRLAVKYVF